MLKGLKKVLTWLYALGLLVILMALFWSLPNSSTKYLSYEPNLELSSNEVQNEYQAPGVYKVQDRLAVNLKKSKKSEPTYLINDFPTFNQFPDYPTGCESIALYNMLRYYDVEVTPDEIVNTLKKGDDPYWQKEKLYGGNPEIEFVGDPRDIHSYGVYQKPIIEVANKFKPGMVDYTGHSLNEVLEIVKKGIPVQVWVSVDLKDTEVCASWTHKETNQQIDWTCGLHSVVIVGFNKTEVIVSDSTNGEIVHYEREQFKKIYNLFGQRAIYYPE